jgi:putative membrane-bound dehydrogenase-like protein
MKLALLVLFGLVVPTVAVAEDPRPILVGVAKVDITPSEPILLSGYQSRGTNPSKGTAQALKAVALAIGSDEQGASLVVTVDNLGIPDAMTGQLAARLKSRAGITRERLAVGASHTHSAPCLPGVAPNIFAKPIPPDQQAVIDRYGVALLDKLEQACLDALKDRSPAHLAWGQGSVDFAMNRRTRGGPVDHALPILRAVGLDGKLRAVLVNYACHCTTLDPKDHLISGDWAADARETIEADHPGSTALVLIGCGADANPKDRTGREIALRHGRAIGVEVSRLLKGPLTPLNTPPVGRITRLKIPFDTLPTIDELKALVVKGGAPGYNASTQLARIDRGEPLQSELDYVVQAWHFGDDLAIVFLAGEVVVDYVLRLKSELDAKRLWVVAYANDDPCYIPSERILREGGYEGGGAMVYYGWPTRLKPGVEDKIITAVRDLVPPAFDAPKVADQSSPAEGLASIRVPAGLKVELVAAEPLVQSPVAIDWGSDGKLWVCEMRDYPSGLDGQGKLGGRIVALEDLDSDGRYDKATTFLDELPFPTGVMAWKKGVLVCAAPDILYAEDTNGDGRADVRQLLYRGFATENFQARVNGLAYGLDNWVYGANGLIGGKIRGEKTGKEVVLGGRDFRIKPDIGAFEPASGLTQQGRVRDDWGNQFGGNNSIWIQHYPLPDHYARRNRSVASPSPAVYLPQGPDDRRVYPISLITERFNHPESAGQVTSACSPLIHRDPYLGESYFGNAFICEPVHNLVHREVLTPDGVTFASHRAATEQSSEFFASTDPWCRPVQVRTGPDGALYVVDMYRQVIEHPRWISPERLAGLDVRAGADRGRIYRVIRDDESPRVVPVLDRVATPIVALTIDSPNGTLRDMAQRVLVDRKNDSAAPALRELARSSPRPETRMQALCTLDGLHELRSDTIRAALLDPHPGIREQAVRLAESRLNADPNMGPALLSLVEDPSIRVRYQLALTLGEWDDSRAGRALGRIASRDATDRWVRAAALSSSVRRPGEIIEAALASDLDPSTRSSLLEPLIATAASGKLATLDPVVDACVTPIAGTIPPWRLATLAAVLEATSRSTSFLEHLRAKADKLGAAFDAARALARNPQADPLDRVSALRLVGRDHPNREVDLALFAELLGPREPTSVQSAALRGLTRLEEDRVPALLLEKWPGLSPGQRGAVLDALLARPSWTSALLGALETQAIRSGEIDAARRQALLALPDATLRAKAAALLTAPGGRSQVVNAYRDAAYRPGDPARGEPVFARLCATCHKVGERGHEVGPDLRALTDTSPEALLVAILDPNREVDARYVNYTAAMTDGRVASGLIASETGNALTLKRQEGQEDVILRANLEEMKNTGQSLMPEGLERDLTPVELADLLAFLDASNRPKTQPGNHPETVSADPSGAIDLKAETASIHGEALVFEAQFRNLGYWQSPSDRAVWTFRVDRPTTFNVALDYACADDSSGNAFLIRVGTLITRGIVGGTGGWSNYRPMFVREVTLPVGIHRLEIRPAPGPIRNALFDLREVTLTPR